MQRYWHQAIAAGGWPSLPRVPVLGLILRIVHNETQRGVAGAGQVVLITGPMGTGKSSLAQHLAHRCGWESISEDTFWVENGWGSGLRSPEQEDRVQRQVVDLILERCWSGRSVVLEFILYSEPPNPLSAYTQAFANLSIACDVVVLKASVAETVAGLRVAADRETFWS